MIVTINIKGSGTVVGAGEYSEGDSISLTATPIAPLQFKGWFKDSDLITENPYVFYAPSIDVTLVAEFYLSVESWLSNKGYSLDDSVIVSIIAGRGISVGTDIDSLTLKQKDLLYADYLMTVYNSPNTGASEEQMGNWKSKGKSITQTGKAGLLNLANSLYCKWGEYRGGYKVIDITNRW